MIALCNCLDDIMLLKNLVVLIKFVQAWVMVMFE